MSGNYVDPFQMVSVGIQTPQMQQTMEQEISGRSSVYIGRTQSHFSTVICSKKKCRISVTRKVTGVKSNG
jgi:hypothetical protein